MCRQVACCARRRGGELGGGRGRVCVKAGGRGRRQEDKRQQHMYSLSTLQSPFCAAHPADVISYSQAGSCMRKRRGVHIPLATNSCGLHEASAEPAQRPVVPMLYTSRSPSCEHTWQQPGHTGIAIETSCSTAPHSPVQVVVAALECLNEGLHLSLTGGQLKATVSCFFWGGGGAAQQPSVISTGRQAAVKVPGC